MNKAPEIVYPPPNPLPCLAMTLPLRSLLHSLRGLFWGLTVLCLLAQPVLAAAHEMHETEHAIADAAAGVPDDAVAGESLAPGTDADLDASPSPVAGATPEPARTHPLRFLPIPAPSDRGLTY